MSPSSTSADSSRSCRRTRRERSRSRQVTRHPCGARGGACPARAILGQEGPPNERTRLKIVPHGGRNPEGEGIRGQSREKTGHDCARVGIAEKWKPGLECLSADESLVIQTAGLNLQVPANIHPQPMSHIVCRQSHSNTPIATRVDPNPGLTRCPGASVAESFSLPVALCAQAPAVRGQIQNTDLESLG